MKVNIKGEEVELYSGWLICKNCGYEVMYSYPLKKSGCPICQTKWNGITRWQPKSRHKSKHSSPYVFPDGKIKSRSRSPIPASQRRKQNETVD